MILAVMAPIGKRTFVFRRFNPVRRTSRTLSVAFSRLKSDIPGPEVSSMLSYVVTERAEDWTSR